MKKYYAGIGSRKTPLELREAIHRIALFLENKGYILRSGGAPGADTMFEEKIDPQHKEIYLPWKGFNQNPSPLFTISAESLEMAQKFHPNWVVLNKWAQMLMARNCYQVLGPDLKTPVDFIVCYTTDGKISGGTGQALRIAKLYNIKVFNLFKANIETELKDYLVESKSLF